MKNYRETLNHVNELQKPTRSKGASFNKVDYTK